MTVHDLRSPIGAIKGFIELLLDETLELTSPEQVEFSKLIDNSCQQARFDPPPGSQPSNQSRPLATGWLSVPCGQWSARGCA